MYNQLPAQPGAVTTTLLLVNVELTKKTVSEAVPTDKALRELIPTGLRSVQLLQHTMTYSPD